MLLTQLPFFSSSDRHFTYLRTMNFIAIIPARYASTRFPGKPLAILAGKPIIQRVYERVSSVIQQTYVATDDERIKETVEAFGGKVVMTAVTHPSGTDRCYEAYTKVKQNCQQNACNDSMMKDDDVVINVQGDEPFIHPTQLQSLMECFDDESTDIATLVKPFTPEAGLAALKNPNSPKVAIGGDNSALYFSRSVIPYLRNYPEEEWLSRHTFYKHIGLYAYRANTLRQITKMPQGQLEKAESLEQLRWLEAGIRIKVGKTNIETIGIDTTEDLARAEQLLANCQ